MCRSAAKAQVVERADAHAEGMGEGDHMCRSAAKAQVVERADAHAAPC